MVFQICGMLNLAQASGNGKQELWEDCPFQIYCKYEVANKNNSAIKKLKVEIHPE
jgi:hypothetical protein